MEKELSEKSGLSQEIKKLVQSLGQFPEKFAVSPDFYQREEYWSGVTKYLREAVGKGELSWDQFDSILGNLAAAKEWLSDHDALTGLYNFRSYQERIESSVAAAERYGTPLTLMVIDIDHFKQLNDELGHDIGNLFLVSLATLLQEEARKDDFLARYGGEEFVIISPNLNRENSIIFVERLRRKTSEYLNSSIPEVQVTAPVTISIGVGQWRKGETPETLFQRIDGCLLKAKEEGRNRVVVAE